MSSAQAQAYHSITIGDKNTWDDWHLVPTSRPLVNPPQVKTNYVDLPGGDGVLDLTTALSGRPTYGNRSGSWEFLVMNGYQDWSTLYSEIMIYLHGQEFRAILDDDPNYFYLGRFSVNSWKSNKNWSSITIDYNVGPYKKSVYGSDQDWLWDPFNFETGVIRSYKNLTVDGTLEMTIPNDFMETVPTILTSESGMSVTFEGETYTLAKGGNVNPNIRLVQGENVLTFTGTGTVTIQIQEGRL